MSTNIAKAWKKRPGAGLCDKIGNYFYRTFVANENWTTSKPNWLAGITLRLEIDLSS